MPSAKKKPAASKSAPTRVPVRAAAGAKRRADSLAANLKRAGSDPASRPQAYLRLRVAGGLAGERYEFDYRIAATGQASASLQDEMKQRRPAASRRDASAAHAGHFGELLRTMGLTALSRLPAQTTPFPPDSLVGRLEVSDGEQTVTHLFMADEAQARGAKLAPRAALRQAADLLFRAAAAQMGIDDARP